MRLFSIIFLTSLATATFADIFSSLDVVLHLIGNTTIRATVTNNGENDIKVLRTGSILSEAPIEKVQVFKQGKQVTFDGVHLVILDEYLGDEDFLRIPAGGSVETVFDAAELHDLSPGGKFEFIASGAFRVASVNSTAIVNTLPFETAPIEADVDGELASLARKNFLQRRTRIQPDCTGTSLVALLNAISGCARLAQIGQSAAQSGPAAKMDEFYKSSSSSTRSTVAEIFSRARTECGSPTSGASVSYCTDVYGNVCTSSVLSYALPSGGYMVFCPSFFTMLPATSFSCYGPSQASVVLHEATHTREVGATSDFGGYGYEFVRGLSAEQNLRHADTYATFAQAVSVGC